MKNMISIVFLLVLCVNIFAQSDNPLDNRCCEKITNEKITNEIIGCWTLTHRQDKDGNIIDNPVDTDYCFMKDGTFFMIKSKECFEGTWTVNSCGKFNLLLKSKKPLMLSEELEYFKQRGVQITNISYMTIYKISSNILTFSVYDDIEEDRNNPEKLTFYQRNNNPKEIKNKKPCLN